MLGRSNSNCNHRDPQTSRSFVLTSAHPSSPIPPSPLMPARPPPTPFTPIQVRLSLSLDAVTHARCLVPSRDPTRTASFGHGHTYMAHSVHTPPASRTPQSIRTPSPAPWPSRRTLKFCSLPDAPAPVAGAHSKFRAPSTKAAESKLQLALSRSRADIPRLRYVGCSKSPPLLLRFSAFLRRTTASNAFELRDNVARAAHGSSCVHCAPRPPSPKSQGPSIFQLPSFSLLLALRALDRRRPSGSCPRDLLSAVPQVPGGWLTGSHSHAEGSHCTHGVFLAAQRGNPCTCTLCVCI